VGRAMATPVGSQRCIRRLLPCRNGTSSSRSPLKRRFGSRETVRERGLDSVTHTRRQCLANSSSTVYYPGGNAVSTLLTWYALMGCAAGKALGMLTATSQSASSLSSFPNVEPMQGRIVRGRRARSCTNAHLMGPNWFPDCTLAQACETVQLRDVACSLNSAFHILIKWLVKACNSLAPADRACGSANRLVSYPLFAHSAAGFQSSTLACATAAM
jgi:hypothetical protein